MKGRGRKGKGKGNKQRLYRLAAGIKQLCLDMTISVPNLTGELNSAPQDPLTVCKGLLRKDRARVG